MTCELVRVLTPAALMMRNLSDFISLLEARGELVRVKARVDPVLEIAAIADRLSKCATPHPPSNSAKATDPAFFNLGGPAVLFENVEGSDIPVLINAFGSYRRMELALGRTFQDVADQIAALVKPQPPRSLAEALALLKRVAPLRKVPPKRRRTPARHHEVVLTGDQIDLTRLPLLRCWPLDGDLPSVGWPTDINAGIEGMSHGPEWDARHRGRYITLAGIHTIHADDRDDPKPPSHNIGMYRVQLLGPRRLAMHWHMHHDGASHWRSWKGLGQPMPVAIVLGGEPILPYAATAPLPPGISELLMAGFLNQRGIKLARARTVPLWVPANAEIVIEGFASHEAGPIGFQPASVVGRLSEPASGVDRLSEPVSGVGRLSEPVSRRSREQDADPSSRFGSTPDSGLRPEAGSESQPTTATPDPGAVIEGPFGDHTGFYSLPDRYPIVTVTAITMRRKPIYPTTVVGLPPQEDYFLGKATERIFFPLLKTLIHDIEDYHLPMFGAFHNCAFVKIKKAYPLHARRVMHAIWGAGQMSWTKCIFVVDHDVDVHNQRAVFEAMAAHCHAQRDVHTVDGPLDILDHAAPYLGAGTKVGFDCTPKWEGAETLGLPADHAGSGRPAAPLSDAHRLTLERTIREGLSTTPGVLGCRLHAEAPGWLFVAVDRGEGDPPRLALNHTTLPLLQALGRALDRHPDLLAHVPRFAAVLGRDVDLDNPHDCLFHWLANCDPGRDAMVSEDVDKHRSPQDRVVAFLAYDATPKHPRAGERRKAPTRAWPPVLRVDTATQELIMRRWDEYGLSAYSPVV